MDVVRHRYATELGEQLPRAGIPAHLGSSGGTVTDVAIAHGAYWATYGRHVLTQARDADGNRVLWLYGEGAPSEGTTVDGTTVDGRPAGITAGCTILGGDSDTAVISYALAGERHLAPADLTAAKVVGDVTVPTEPAAVARAY
ncbi:hypothetical protein GCM10023084_52520 [Streptomyces lacrimifluminis]|uniref:Uncharacterized protein n=1 Tax=Streptomyces lacrimifluminis TaxID=1500077 RepID=A0A917P2B8_9ACTN|nr:hypothetical protein [Streptomyces lacrimifluminis]GGJ54548.1 hypothetical protein GCM10012282_59640 [Streptomyces lacrimifluminis]